MAAADREACASRAPAGGETTRGFMERLLRPPRLPSTLDRHIAGAILIPILTIAAALGLLMMLERARVLLAEMTAIGMSPRFFLPLMLRLAPFYLMQAIPAAFAVSLVLAIGRMEADHEWEVMAAAGVSPARAVLPMMVTGVVLASLTLSVAGWLEPVGRYGYRTLHKYGVSESQLRKLQSQEIYAPGDDAMLTADSIASDGLHGLFMWLEDDKGHASVLTAPWGLVATQGTPSSIDFHLKDGVLVSGDKISARFDDLAGSHPLASVFAPRARGKDARELTLSELLVQTPATLDERPRNQRAAEVYNRILRSFSIMVLPFIAFPLLAGGVGGRRRRWGAVALILVLVVGFYHGINFARNLVANGKLDVWHATILTTALPLAVTLAVWHGGRYRRLGERLARAFRNPLRRIPSLRWRGWPDALAFGRDRSLAHYLTARLLVTVTTVLVAMVTLLQLVDLFENGDDLVHNGADLSDFAYYVWCRLPQTLLQATPIAMLGGGLLVWARMRTSSELIAIQASGISTFGILRRVLVVPAVAGLMMIAISEFWAPASQIAFTQWWDRLAADNSEIAPTPARWFRMGGEIVQATMTETHGDELTGVSIYRRDGDGRLVERVVADAARWTEGRWRLIGGRSWRVAEPDADPRPLADDLWATTLTPPEVRQFFAAPIPLSGRDAWAAGHNGAPTDRARSLYQTRILMTFSVAAAPLVMLLLSIALIVTPTREKPLARGVFQCLVGGLSFLVMNGYCEVMGLNGEMAPALAVLAAPAVFAWFGLDRMLAADGAC